MAYNIARQVSPALAICSLSSVASGLATITFINGDFTPNILLTSLTLDAGFEYFLVTSPATTSAVTATYETLIDSVSQGSYPIRSTTTTSALDETIEVTKASCKVTEPPGVLIVNGCVNVLPALVIVWLPRPAKVIVPVPVSVVPVPLIQLP